MPTLDGVTVEATGTVVTAFSIERMNVDLFQFWLEQDWLFITHDLLNLETKPIAGEDHYIRFQPVIWLEDKQPVYVTVISWAQTFTDEIRVEITNGHTLTERIVAWAIGRKWISEVGAPTQREIKPAPIADSLTEQEKVVAGYLAQRLSYAEIAERLNIKIGTVKTHINAIARKWGTRAIHDILWIESQRRLY